MIKPTDGRSDSNGSSRDGAPDSGGHVPGEPGHDPGFLARFKEFRATSLAVDHQTSVLVLFAFITIAGLIAYQVIPRESFPEIEIPMIAVNTIYPGVTPADIESLITRPLEDELSTISDIKDLTSTSVEGYSSIVAEFEATANLEGALQKVREKVDLAKAELPAEAEDPSIIEFNFSEMPIMQVNLSGQYGLVRLKELGEEMQDRVEQIPGVLRADIRGGREREVRVDVHLDRLQFYGLEIQDVIDAIRDENVNIPGGSIDVGPLQYLVRVAGEFDDPMIIQDLVVATEDGRPIYVRDIADVDFGFQDRTSYARLDAAQVVTLDVPEALRRKHHRDRRTGESRNPGDGAASSDDDRGKDHIRPVGNDRNHGEQPREQHHLGAHPYHRRASLLPRRWEFGVRGYIDPHVHVAFLRDPAAPRGHPEYRRTLHADPRFGHARRQRHRRGREHLPVRRGGLGPAHSGEEGNGRSGHAGDRRNGDHARRLRPAPLLAGPGG